MSGASRYQNALIYDPSLYVGRYPERSANTLPRPGLGGSSTRPIVFDPVPELVTGTGPLPVSAGGAAGGGVGGLGAAGAAAGLAGLASPLVKGGAKAIEWMAQHGGAPMAGGFSAKPIDAMADFGGQVDDALGNMMGPQGMGSYAGGAGGGFSAAPIDALADFGGGVDAALGNMMGAQGGSAAGGAGGAGGGFGSIDTSLGFNVNPLNIGAGMLGSWAGNYLGTNAFGPGDPDQRPWTSGIGSAVGGLAGGALAGAAAGSIVPVIGTAIGALVGAFAGAAMGGEPDYPIGYFGGYADYGETGPRFRTGNPGETNGGPGGAAAGMSNSLGAILAQRAAADGYTVAPQFVNQQLFNAGIRADGKNDRFFYNAGDGVPAAADHPMWRGFTFDQLADFAYGDLVGRGVFAAPGTGPSWTDVRANIQGQGDFAGGLTYTGNSEAGNTYTNFDPRGWQTNTYAPPVAAYTGPEIISSGSMGG